MTVEKSRKVENALGLYMEGIRDGRVREAVTKYTGDRYTQHSTGVADGIEGFIAFFEPFLERCPERDIRVVRSLEDGPHVFCHVTQDINGGESRWVTADLFDTDANDKIIEHWDVISAWEEETPGGRSQVGGATEIEDLDQTDSNKELVRDLTNTVLIGGQFDRMNAFVAPDLEQHELAVPGGASPWAQHLREAEVVYEDLFRLIGQGNFVVTYCKVRQGATPLAVFDIYRLEGGRIVERWSNAEEIPSDTGNSGKF